MDARLHTFKDFSLIWNLFKEQSGFLATGQFTKQITPEQWCSCSHSVPLSSTKAFFFSLPFLLMREGGLYKICHWHSFWSLSALPVFNFSISWLYSVCPGGRPCLIKHKCHFWMHSWFEHEDKENFLTVVQLMRPFRVALNWQDALSVCTVCTT